MGESDAKADYRQINSRDAGLKGRSFWSTIEFSNSEVSEFFLCQQEKKKPPGLCNGTVLRNECQVAQSPMVGQFGEDGRSGGI